MEVTVCIRRAIVEDKSIIGRPILALPLVELIGASLYILVTRCSKRSRAGHITLAQHYD